MQATAVKQRGWLRRHVRAAMAIGVALAGLAAFVLVYFQPQDLFIDNTVNDPLPTASPPPATSPALPAETGSNGGANPGRIPVAAASPTVLGRGAFRSGEHDTTGTATLLRLADGRVFVRLENLSTSNGPDVHIWLSTAPSTASDDGVDSARHLDVGELQANHGNQNYRVPAGAGLTGYRSVVVWCDRFDVVFGAAPLGRA